MKLYFSRNPNPRLAVAVARYLKAEVVFEYASPQSFGEAERFRPLNPNLLLPILERPGRSLWEADAIACFLSRRAGDNFWRTDDDEPEMIRWISLGQGEFRQGLRHGALGAGHEASLRHRAVRGGDGGGGPDGISQGCQNP